MVRWFAVFAVCSGCSAALRPYPAAMLSPGRTEVTASGGDGPGRRAVLSSGPQAGVAARYSNGEVELCASAAIEVGGERFQRLVTIFNPSLDLRWGAIKSGPIALTPSAGFEGVFGAEAQWIPSLGVAFGTAGQWPFDATVTVRVGFREFAVPEITLTPAVRYELQWFSLQAGGDVIGEPTAGNVRVRPYVGVGGAFGGAPR